MRDDTKNNRERKVQITVLEREPTTEGREAVILTVISARDRNRNTSEWMKAWTSSNVN